MRFLPYFAVYLVLKNDQNQILLSKRVNTGFMDGFYSLRSCHVDENESATTALERAKAWKKLTPAQSNYLKATGNVQ
jgi:ADP-ribose pyrophosphatase YjhB (NUDIX family)